MGDEGRKTIAETFGKQQEPNRGAARSAAVDLHKVAQWCKRILTAQQVQQLTAMLSGEDSKLNC